MKRYFIHFITLLIASNLIGQATYFNNAYNYNNFSPALAVIEYDYEYILFGVTNDSINNNVSAYIACIDSIGNLKYWKTISDSAKQYWAGYRGSGLSKVDQMGFAAVGSVGTYIDSSNAILYRFNCFGDTLWTKQYSDPDEFLRFHDCNTTSDNGFIMTGYQLVWNSYSDILLIKADSLGNEQWRQEYGDAGLNIEKGYSVVQTPDNGYLIGYYQWVAGQDETGDPVVMKVDSLGNFIWEQNIGGPYGEFVPRVCIGNDGTYITGVSIADSAGQNYSYSRIKLYRFSTDGDVLWEKYYCKTDVNNILYAVYPDHDGGYIATGKRHDYYNPQGQWWNSFGWLLKVNENGDSLWYREYQYYTGTGDDYNDLYDLCLTTDGGYTMVGQISTWVEPQTAWVIKVDSLGCDTPGCATGMNIYTPRAVENEALWIYPNPANAYLKCSLQITNVRCLFTICLAESRMRYEFPKGKRRYKLMFPLIRQGYTLLC
jgi:hypothetical protein